MPQFGRRTLALLALSSLASGCDVGGDCSALDCESGVWAVVTPASGSWENGEYALEVTHDGETESCSFTLPDTLPVATVSTFVDCGPHVRVSLYALSGCTDDCQPENEFEIDLRLDSTPDELTIKLTRGEDELLNDERRVDYEQLYPRGEECGGGCRQSHLELSAKEP